MNEHLHLDLATLDMLQEILGDGFPGLLETFIRDAGDRLEALRAGVAAGDADEVRASAHSLKGSSSNLGAHPMAERCLQVEQRAREGELTGLDEILEQVEAEFHIVKGMMEERLQQR